MNSLLRFVFRRILFMIPLFLVITILTFYMMDAIGDPVTILLAEMPGVSQSQIEMVKKFFGQDLPVSVRYLRWLTDVLRLDFGRSIFKGLPVGVMLETYGLQTLKLQLAALAISLPLSIFLGVEAAVNQYTKKDVLLMSSALLSRSIPGFWLGLILILVFSVWLGCFPSFGAVSIADYLYGNQILDELWHMALPTSMICFFDIATFTLLLRSSMLDVLREDFVLAARASGLSRRTVIWKHALRNAVIPLISYVGYTFGIMIASSPVTETVFSWPGLGVLFVDAITNLDYPTVMGVVFILVITVFAANLASDIIHVMIDPRLKLE